MFLLGLSSNHFDDLIRFNLHFNILFNYFVGGYEEIYLGLLP